MTVTKWIAALAVASAGAVIAVSLLWGSQTASRNALDDYQAYETGSNEKDLYFCNTVYRYCFKKYPGVIQSLDSFEGGIAPEISDRVEFLGDDWSSLEVAVLDPDILRSIYPRWPDVYTKKPRDIALLYWQRQKELPPNAYKLSGDLPLWVSELEEISFVGRTAYSFKVTGALADYLPPGESFGAVSEAEVVVVEHDNKTMVISVIGRGDAEAALATFLLLEPQSIID